MSELPVDDFQRDGVAVLRGVLSDDEVALLRAGVDAVMAAPTPAAISTGGGPGEPGAFFEDFCTWMRARRWSSRRARSRTCATWTAGPTSSTSSAGRSSPRTPGAPLDHPLFPVLWSREAVAA